MVLPVEDLEDILEAAARTPTSIVAAILLLE
jgi:hypothetical protein